MIDIWQQVNFSRWEFRCRDGCGLDSIDIETLMLLQEVRDHFGQPVKINSAHRCPAHNASIGGKPQSQHLYARAADIVVLRVPAIQVQAWLSQRMARKWGLGCYAGFTHVDTRSGPPARWSG